MAGAVGAESRARALRSASRACGSRVRVLPLGFEWGRNQRDCLSVERKPVEVSRSGASVEGKPLRWYLPYRGWDSLEDAAAEWKYESLT